MKLKLNEWVFVCGKANAGKTYWIKAHLQAVPQEKLWIYDFNCSDFQEFNKAHLYNVEYGTEDEAAKFMMESYKAGNNLTVLEEADNYLASKQPDIVRFVNTARNRGIGCLISAKRSKAVPPRYRTRINKIVAFHTTLPDDVVYLEEWTGIKKSGQTFDIDGYNNLELLRKLDVGEHIIIDLDNQQISGVQKV
jgi:hypothetical protein